MNSSLRARANNSTYVHLKPCGCNTKKRQPITRNSQTEFLREFRVIRSSATPLVKKNGPCPPNMLCVTNVTTNDQHNNDTVPSPTKTVVIVFQMDTTFPSKKAQLSKHFRRSRQQQDQTVIAVTRSRRKKTSQRILSHKPTHEKPRSTSLTAKLTSALPCCSLLASFFAPRTLCVLEIPMNEPITYNLGHGAPQKNES